MHLKLAHNGTYYINNNSYVYWLHVLELVQYFERKVIKNTPTTMTGPQPGQQQSRAAAALTAKQLRMTACVWVGEYVSGAWEWARAIELAKRCQQYLLYRQPITVHEKLIKFISYTNSLYFLFILFKYFLFCFWFYRLNSNIIFSWKRT